MSALAGLHASPDWPYRVDLGGSVYLTPRLGALDKCPPEVRREMLNDIMSVMSDWRFPAGVVFVGPLLQRTICTAVSHLRGTATNIPRSLRA